MKEKRVCITVFAHAEIRSTLKANFDKPLSMANMLEIWRQQHGYADILEAAQKWELDDVYFLTEDELLEIK